MDSWILDLALSNSGTFKDSCTPATSIPSERLYCKSGLLLSKQKSQLREDIVSNIKFLKKKFGSNSARNYVKNSENNLVVEVMVVVVVIIVDVVIIAAAAAAAAVIIIVVLMLFVVCC